MSEYFNRVGQKYPDFTMSTTEDIETLEHIVRREDYQGKWLVFFFYPLDFAFICPTEIKGFNSKLSQFKRIGAEILGVSTDSIYSHRAWIRASKEEGGLGDLNYPLASDITKQVSRDYGVLIEEKSISLRSLFIIDPEGVIRYQVVSDLNVGRSVDEILRVLKALQSGGLCPIDWKPGERTL